jgi:hypothetical protein
MVRQEARLNFVKTRYIASLLLPAQICNLIFWAMGMRRSLDFLNLECDRILKDKNQNDRNCLMLLQSHDMMTSGLS